MFQNINFNHRNIAKKKKKKKFLHNFNICPKILSFNFSLPDIRILTCLSVSAKRFNYLFQLAVLCLLAGVFGIGVEFFTARLVLMCTSCSEVGTKCAALGV